MCKHHFYPAVQFAACVLYSIMPQECGSLSNNSEHKHDHRVIMVTQNLYAAYQTTESCSGWGANMQSYLPLLLKMHILQLLTKMIKTI